MAQRFRGESLNKVDSKGRVSIPAGFRRVIEQADPNWTEGLRPELVLMWGNPRTPYVECFTMEAIEEVDRQIADLQRGSMERRMLERIVNAGSQKVEVDPDGRLVLPPKARDKLKLAGENALFLGAGDTFQIWSPETYEADETAMGAWLDTLGPDVDPFTFLPGRS